MKPQFLAMLPGELQNIVQEAERVAGCEIDVVSDAAASEFDSLTFGVDSGACIATIAYRGKCISRCALIHELLHLKRYWLDTVPILRSTYKNRYEFEAQIVEDLIEHLIVIPEERRYAETESNAHWSLGMVKLAANVHASRRSLLLQRAMMDIALPALDHTRLYDRLRNENLINESAGFVDRLRSVLTDKERALFVVCQQFRYDLTGFCVGRYDLRTHPKSFDRYAVLTDIGQ